MDAAASDAPAADIAVDAALVAALLHAQHPDLAGSLHLVANGWDNTIWRLGDDLAVRLPRREIAAGLIETEQRWLPELAPRLPVAVPAPVRVGRADDLYPWPWSVVPWIAGRQAASVDPAGRTASAARLADVVHALAVPAPPDAPHNPWRAVPLADRDADVRARLADDRLPRARELRALWADCVAAAPWRGEPSWVHGDLHPGNLVLDAHGGLAAVIDFGDLSAGDPATDLATAWLTFDPPGRAVFRQRMRELRDLDDADWLRAQGWAIVLASAIVSTVQGDGPIARIGHHGLSQVLQDLSG
ncbi:MAG: aminoglycoside phosphotransferase family protein [Leifsonia sp.]